MASKLSPDAIARSGRPAPAAVVLRTARTRPSSAWPISHRSPSARAAAVHTSSNRLILFEDVEAEN